MYDSLFTFNRFSSHVGLGILIITFISCGSQPNQDSSKNRNVSGETSQRVTTAQNNFGFTLLDHLNQFQDDPENILISPSSIFMDLSMVYNGASGETKKEMKKTLQFSDIPLDSINAVHKQVLEHLTETDAAVTLDMANSIWYRSKFHPKSDFLGVNKDYYQAKIQEADFDDTKTVDEINNWVEKKTQHKIASIIEEIAPDDLMFLLNAIYFKGDWTEPFDEELTHEDAFYAANGDEQDASFMYRKDDFNYTENDSLQVAELPYGDGGFSMVVLLPEEEKSVSELVASMDSGKMKTLQKDMDSTEIKLHLPEWESSYTANDLKQALTEMGMEKAFSPEADLSDMFEESTEISEVKHKTYIKVNEEGTEAAATTSAGISLTSAPVDETVMKVDHPFVYMITENETGNILFLGVVNKLKGE